MNPAHFSKENTTVSRQSKTLLVPDIQKYPKSYQTLSLWTVVGIDGSCFLKHPEHLTQEFRGNSDSSMPFKPICTLLCYVSLAQMSKIHQVEEELLKKVRPRHNPTLTDNLPFEKAVCIVLDLMDFFEFHHTQIVRLNNNRNQELLV
jgi:hypothetical protein